MVIPCLRDGYNKSPDMSVYPTGKSGGQIGRCKAGFRASEATQSFSGNICKDRRSGAPDDVWLEHAHLKHHPVSRRRFLYLSIKPTERIHKTMQEELGFSDKRDTQLASMNFQKRQVLCSGIGRAIAPVSRAHQDRCLGGSDMPLRCGLKHVG